MKGRAEYIKGRYEKQKGKEEAATTVWAEPVQEQVDSISLEIYREKLYIEVSLTKPCIIVRVLFFSCKAHLQRLRGRGKHFVKLRKLADICPLCYSKVSVKSK